MKKLFNVFFRIVVLSGAPPRTGWADFQTFSGISEFHGAGKVPENSPPARRSVFQGRSGIKSASQKVMRYVHGF
jgi:hypothetical protein